MLVQNDGRLVRCSSPKLNRIAKSVVALCLCMVMVFAYSYRKPVKVEAAMTGGAVAGAALIGTALVALGIGVAASYSNVTFADQCQQIWDGLTDPIKESISLTEISGAVTAHFTGEALRSIFEGAKEVVPQAEGLPILYTHEGAFSGVADAVSYFNNIGMAFPEYLVRTKSGIDTLDLAGQGIPLDQLSNFRVVSIYTVPDPTYDFSTDFSIPVATGGNFDASLYGDAGGTRTPWFQLAGNSTHNAAGEKLLQSTGLDAYTYSSSGCSLLSFPNYHFSIGSTFLIFLFDRLLEGQSLTYTCLFATSEAVAASGLPVAVGLDFKDDSDVIGANPPYDLGQDVFNPADDDFFADGYSAMNTDIDDVIDRLKERLGETADDGTVSVPAKVADKTGVTDDTKAQDQADTLGRDIATDADRARDAATNTARDTSTPKPSTLPDLTIPQMITRKFPFSIPWDLYNAVSIMASPGAAPSWTIPFDAPALGVHTSITIDFVQFDLLASILRWGLGLLFLIALIILTGRVIKH